MYFNLNFNVIFNLIKVRLFVSELYINFKMCFTHCENFNIRTNRHRRMDKVIILNRNYCRMLLSERSKPKWRDTIKMYTKEIFSCTGLNLFMACAETLSPFTC